MCRVWLEVEEGLGSLTQYVRSCHLSHKHKLEVQNHPVLRSLYHVQINVSPSHFLIQLSNHKYCFLNSCAFPSHIQSPFYFIYFSNVLFKQSESVISSLVQFFYLIPCLKLIEIHWTYLIYCRYQVTVVGLDLFRQIWFL